MLPVNDIGCENDGLSRCVLDRVGQQIVQDNAESCLIHLDHILSQLWLYFHFKRYFSIDHIVLEEVHNIIDSFLQIYAFKVGLKLALFDLGHLQNVVSSEYQLLQNNAHHVDVLLGHLVEARHNLGHRPVKLNQRVQRGKQVVSNRVNKQI